MSGPRGLAERLFSSATGWMLVRNTIVSTGVFLLGLGLLWLLVEQAGTGTLPATGASFLAATSLHYVLGRTWIFRGTERRVLPGYGFFLANALVGLVLTLGLMAAFLAFVPLHYLASRILVSFVAGLAMFLLNGILNFRRI